MARKELSPTEERQFFIQSVDGPSGFALSEIYCGYSTIEAVRNAIDADIAEFDTLKILRLDDRQVRAIEKLFSIEFEPSDNETYLRSWSPHDGLPYRVHPNRELILMLSGEKPLSVLSGGIPASDSFEEIPEYLFDPYVESGAFAKTDYCEPNPAKHPYYKGMRFVLYALAHEAWRMDAYILMRNVAGKAGWTDALTRLEGSLLGYAEWQNDAFIARMQERRGPR
jgi:hypothetical protein